MVIFKIGCSRRHAVIESYILAGHQKVFCFAVSLSVFYVWNFVLVLSKSPEALE